MPTPSGWSLATATLLGAPLAVATGYPQLLALTAGALVLLLAAFLARPASPPEPDVPVRTVRCRPGRPGRPGTVPVLLRNPGRRSSSPVRVVARLRGADGRPAEIAADCPEVAPSSVLTVDLPAGELARGVYSLTEVTASSCDALGLFRRDRRVRDRVEVRVQPRIADLGPSSSGRTGGRRRSPGLGEEFDALRPYSPGDDVRHMSWMATARTGVPVVRDPAPPRTCEAVLLDSSAVHPGTEAFEQAVGVAAALALAALQRGDLWVLTADDRQRFAAGSAADTVLDRLAAVRPLRPARWVRRIPPFRPARSVGWDPALPREATSLTVVTGPAPDGPRWRALAGPRELTVMAVGGPATIGSTGRRTRVVPVPRTPDLPERVHG